MPSTLPVQVSSFVGRAAELEHLAQLVRNHRLVTVVGLGGMGKTRIALQYAQTSFGEFPDGCWFASLKEISDASYIALATGKALGLASDRPQQSEVFEHLWKARCLLILDNAEHLLADVASFARNLLDAAPDVRVLVTSREPLHVEGEQSLRLGGIDEGAGLFIDRAYPELPPSQVSKPVVRVIADICSKLQGIPLAIELAAARASAIPPEKLILALDDIRPSETLLDQMIDWSYRLLQPAEQHCFEVIALFESSFSWGAVEAISASADHNALTLLDSLVRKSLVACASKRDPIHYYLLEVVRAYARGRLQRSARVHELARSYTDYYLAYVESLTAPGVDENRMIAGITEDWPNIQGALRRAVDDEIDLQRAYRLIPNLWRFWMVTGRGREGLSWINRALRSHKGATKERVDLLDAAARLAAGSERFAELEPLAQELVAARDGVGEPKALGDSLFMLANAKYKLGATHEAQALYQRALEQFEKSGSRRGTALVLGTMGAIMEQSTISDKARFAEARRLLEMSLAIFREEQSILSCAQALENLGVLCMRSGDLQQALAYTEESLIHYREHGNAERASVAYVSIADVYLALGEPLQALAKLQTGRRVLGDRPHGPFVVYYAESAFKAAIALGAFEAAARLYGFAQHYRLLIRMPLQHGEQAAIARGYAAVELAFDFSSLERYVREGSSMEFDGVHVLVDQLSSTDAPIRTSENPGDSDARGALLHRQRLSSRIDRAAAFPAIFVAASGAWGKSTAVDQYLATKNRPAIRLRLGPDIATLAAFVEVFHRTIAPSLLERNEPAPSADLLLKSLSDYHGFVVIDNFDFADGDHHIAQLLFDLVGKTKGRIQWILISRRAGQAPMGTCMAYGLTGREIDARDLAFTTDDVLDYAQRLHLTATEQEGDTIVGFTNGWPLAINIALRALVGGVAMAPLERMAYVERETVSLTYSYLRENMLGLLDEPQRRLLLTTSAMPGAVQMEVVRQLDADGEHTITQLRNLVPIAMIADGVYQLPYLYKRFLRTELDRSPQRLAICRGLADAYENVGEAISAIKVLLDIGQFDAIANILVGHAQTWANADWPDELESVMARLPAQMLESDPTLLFARAAVAARRNRFEQAFQLLDHALPTSGPEMYLRIACAQTALCINSHRPAKVATLELAMERKRDDPEMWLRARALLCCAYIDEQRREPARELLKTLFQDVDKLVLSEENVDIVYWIATAAFLIGDYVGAQRSASRISLGCYTREPSLVLAQTHDLQSRIAAEVGAPIDEILHHNSDAILTAQKISDTRYYTAYLRRRCTILYNHGRLDLIELAMNQPDTIGTQLWTVYSNIFRWLKEIQSAANAETADQATAFYSDALPISKALADDPMLCEDPFVASAYFIMTGCLANDRTISNAIEKIAILADQVLDQLPEDAPRTKRRHATIARLTGILCNIFLGAHRPLSRLTADLEMPTNDAVTAAVGEIAKRMIYDVLAKRSSNQRVDKGGMMREAAFAELHNRGYGTIAKMLHALASRFDMVVTAGVALSKSETEILFHMGKGLSASQIAEARHSSVDTVRSQQKSIYRKLDVRSAAEALSRARNMGIL